MDLVALKDKLFWVNLFTALGVLVTLFDLLPVGQWDAITTLILTVLSVVFGWQEAGLKVGLFEMLEDLIDGDEEDPAEAPTIQ